MTDLQRSHAELRGAVILAGKEIRGLNFGRADSPVLVILRRVLRESRAVARREGITMRVRLDLPTRRAQRSRNSDEKANMKLLAPSDAAGFLSGWEAAPMRTNSDITRYAASALLHLVDAHLLPDAGALAGLVEG
jgi:hypothetical protein